MSTMLATQNRDAADRINNPRPLPGEGDTVVFHLRPGAIRAGSASVPAWVLKVDHDNRLLKLLVIYGHDDMMTEERVPERIGSDYGWEIKPGPDAQIAAQREEIAGLRAEIVGMSDGLEAFKLELAQTLFGDHDKPDVSFVDRMAGIASAVKTLTALKPPPTKKQWDAAIAVLDGASGK